MSREITIIPLDEKPADDRMVKVSITIPKDRYQKLLDFMAGDTWEKANAARKARLDDCLKSMEIALNWALKHDTSGARVFATLLASMYNGNRVKFDVSDLKLLDGGELFETFIKDWKLEKKARAA